MDARFPYNNHILLSTAFPLLMLLLMECIYAFDLSVLENTVS